MSLKLLKQLPTRKCFYSISKALVYASGLGYVFPRDNKCFSSSDFHPESQYFQLWMQVGNQLYFFFSPLRQNFANVAINYWYMTCTDYSVSINGGSKFRFQRFMSKTWTPNCMLLLTSQFFILY